MIIDLGDGIPVTAMGLAAGVVRMKKALIGIGVFRLKPGKECGPKIEAGALEIIDDLDDFAFGIERPGAGIGVITFVMDALVPIMEGAALSCCSISSIQGFSRGG